MRTSAKFRSLFLLVFLFQETISGAQTAIPLGTWRYHPSFSQKTLLDGSNSTLFAMGPRNLLYYSFPDGSSVSLSRTDGLYGQDFTAMAYVPSSKVLILAYPDGTLDWVGENKIQRVNTLRTNDLILQKEIHRIRVMDQQIYLAADFGLALLDLSSGEFRDAYLNLGPSGNALPVYDVANVADSLYLTTDLGILAGNVRDNLKDFRNWKLIIDQNRPGFQKTEVLNDNLFLQGNDGRVYQLANGQLDWVIGTENVLQLKSIQGQLYFSTADEILMMDENGSFFPIAQNITLSFQDFFVQEENLFLASETDGLVEWPTTIHIEVNGTFAPTQKFVYSGDAVFSFPQRIEMDGSTVSVSNPEVYQFTEGKWQPSTLPKSTLCMINWRDNWIYGTLGDGIHRRQNDPRAEKWELEGISENATISDLILHPDGALIGSVLDMQGRLFRINSSDELDWVIVPNLGQPIRLLADRGGNIWVLERLGTGSNLRVFNEATGLNRVLGTSSNLGGLPSDRILDFHLDTSGNVWVATENGPAYFLNPSSITANSPVNAILPVFENRNLLANQIVRQIRVSPDDTKWFGTENSGLWQFSEDTDVILQQFNRGNSPLPSNSIEDLVLNEISGELFVVTGKGALSYRAGSIKAAEKLEELKIFPNPVRPDFNGLLSIEGLTDFSEIKITNSAGRVVVSMVVRGGKITWHLRDPNGQRVPSGVYLVYVLDPVGKERVAGKFLVI